VNSAKTLTLAGTDAITGSVFSIFVGSPQAAPSNSVLFPFFLISDLNSDDPMVTLTIQANGSFVPISGSGLTITQSSNEITIAGLLSDVNNALSKNVIYTPASTSDTLTLSITDGSGDTAFRTISLNTSNPAAPSFTNTGASGEITNTGTMDVTGTTTLNSDLLLNNTGTVKVEPSALLILHGTKFNGGTITDNGSVEISGFDSITNATLNIGTSDQLTIDTNATLYLNGTTIAGLGTLTDNGTLIATSGTSDIAVTLNGTGTDIIESGATLDVTGSLTGTGSITIQSGGTFGVGTAITQTLTLGGTGATLDLLGIQAKSAVISGSTLTVTESNNTTLTYTVAGALAGNAFTVASDGNGGSDLTLEPIGYLWTTTGNLINVPGQHLYAPHSDGNSSADAAMIIIGSTPSASFNSTGPDDVTENVALADPFFLPYDAGFQPIDNGPLVSLPFRNKIIFPNLTAATTEGIAIYETDDASGNPVLDRAIITDPSGPNASLNINPILSSSPGVLEALGLPGTIYTLDVAYTGSLMTSYAVAWDLYNATAQSFNIYLATFDSSNNPLISGGHESILSQSGVASPTSEVWDLKNAGALKTDGQAVGYGLVMPQVSGANEDIVFSGYLATGTVAPGVSFTVVPNLSDFAGGATNQLINPDLAGQSVLQYTPNAVAGSGFSVAWSEQVHDSNGTHYQVEFAIFRPNFENASGVEQSGVLVSQSVFQVADAQNVRVGDYSPDGATSDEFLAYGDATSTTIIEFNQSGQQIASVTDLSPTGQVYSGFDVKADGLVAVTYNGSSQDTIDVYDFRQTGLNNPTLSTTSTNYVRGTEYADLVTGAANVDNFYYYVGENTTSQSSHFGPSDTFSGGTGTAWNEAVFGDTRSDYAIAPSGSGFTVTYTDPTDLHSGSLTVDANVQALAFDPSQDPSPTTVSGNTALVVTSGETLTLLHPSTFNFDISGLSASNTLELEGYDASTTATPGSFNGTTTVLTASDPGHATLSLTLLGDYSSSTFTVTSDGNGGVFIVDPPAITATIAAGATLAINSPSNETVTFNGGTGALVLNDPGAFSGQIVGFTGTAPDAAHSDTVDLIGINYDSAQFAESYNSATGLLTITDGTHSASITFDNFNATLDFASDGNGGTLITDPPLADTIRADGTISIADSDPRDTYSVSVTPEGHDYVGSFSLHQDSAGNGANAFDWEFSLNKDGSSLAAGQTLIQSYDISINAAQNPGASQTQSVSVSIGGSGNDQFVFTPGVGTETIANFDPKQDTIELDHFNSAQTVQELESLITTNPHGDAAINLGHNDSVTVAGETPTQLQQLIQMGHVLLH
jgi:hypothetical protein